MRRLSIIVVLLCYRVWAAPAFIQAGSCNAATNTCNVTLGSNTTAGNTLVVFEIDNSSGTQTICDGNSCPTSTDTFSNRIPTVGSSGTSGVAGTYDSVNIAGGVTKIVCTGASATKIACVALEISDIRSWDATPSGNVGSSSTSWISNSFSTDVASAMSIGCAGTVNLETSFSSAQIGGNTATVDANAVTSGSAMSAACLYLVLTSVQTNITANATVSPAHAYVFDAVTYTVFPTQPWVIMP